MEAQLEHPPGPIGLGANPMFHQTEPLNGEAYSPEYYDGENQESSPLPYDGPESPISDSGSDDSLMSSCDGPYTCNICGKGFSLAARLQRHQRIHSGEKPYSCEFCDKTFSVKENLNVHRRIHTKERPYKCDICNRAFEHSGKLHRHIRTHTGERPHKCKECGKTFVQSGQLVIHMRAHTGEKPYSCTFCPKGFTCSKQLKVHIRTHTGEKPYKCDECGKTFGYNHVLKMHKLSHLGEKLYKCTLCDNFFNSRKALDTHIREHNEAEGTAKPKRKNTKKKTKTDESKQKMMEDYTSDDKGEGKSSDEFSARKGKNFDSSRQGYSSDDSGRGSSPISNLNSFQFSPPHSSGLGLENHRVPPMDFGIKNMNQAALKFSPFTFPPGLYSDHSMSREYIDRNKIVPKMVSLTTSTGQKVACPSEFVFPIKDEESNDKAQWDLQQQLSHRVMMEETNRQREESFIDYTKRVLKALLQPDILQRLGYPESSVDDILIKSLQVMNTQPCLEPSLSQMARIKVNLRLLLESCVTDQTLWIKFGWRGKSIEEIIYEFLEHC